MSLSPKLVLALQVAMLGAGVLVARDRVIRNIPQIWALLLFAAWAAISLLWAEDLAISGRRWLLVFVPGTLLTLVAASDTNPERTFRRFVWLLILISIGSGAFSLILNLYGVHIRINSRDYYFLQIENWTFGVLRIGHYIKLFNLASPRVSGLTSNPNSFAVLAGISLIAMFAFFQTGSRTIPRSRIFFYVIFVVLATCMYLTFSRAAILMTMTGISAVVLLCVQSRLQSRLMVRGLAVLVLLLPFFLAVHVVMLSGASSTDAISSGADLGIWNLIDLGERGNVWKIAMAELGSVWYIGVGFGLVQEAIFSSGGHPFAAFSIPITIVLETGILGISLMIAAWIRPVFQLTAAHNHLSATGIAVIAILLGLFINQTFESSVFRFHWCNFILFYLLGAAVALARCAENRDHGENSNHV